MLEIPHQKRHESGTEGENRILRLVCTIGSKEIRAWTDRGDTDGSSAAYIDTLTPIDDMPEGQKKQAKMAGIKVVMSCRRRRNGR